MRRGFSISDIDYTGLFTIPVATAILTTFVLLIKEWFQSRNNTKRALIERKLVELYNRLYSLVIKYETRLRITYRNEVYVTVKRSIMRYLKLKIQKFGKKLSKKPQKKYIIKFIF